LCRTQNARNRFDGVLPHLEENMPEGYITLHPSINVLVGTDAKARSLLRNLAASHHAAAFVKGIVGPHTMRQRDDEAQVT
jgi:hypothetical protein